MDMGSLVGFRFNPTNEEIVRLLEMKRLDPDFSVQTIKEIDFYGFDPWELPSFSGIQSEELIWYFYCKPYYFKNSKSNRSRKTKSGYWKITGKGSNMKKNGETVIGSKKILSFCRRSNSKKAKIEWVMHEIKVKDNPLYKEDFVVCCLKRKRNNKLGISTSGDGESSQHLHVAENTLPNSVLPQQVASDRSNEVAENLFPLLSHNSKLQLVSNQLSNGYNALDNDSFSELHSAILDPGSSYSNSPTNGCNFLNSHCDIEQVDNLINSQRAFQNEYSHEETGQTLNPEFNPSKLDGEVYAEDVSEMDTENFNAWVTELLKY